MFPSPPPQAPTPEPPALGFLAGSRAVSRGSPRGAAQGHPSEEQPGKGVAPQPRFSSLEAGRKAELGAEGASGPGSDTSQIREVCGLEPKHRMCSAEEGLGEGAPSSAELTPLCAGPELPASLCHMSQLQERGCLEQRPQRTGLTLSSTASPSGRPRELHHPCSSSIFSTASAALQSQHAPILPSKRCRLLAVPSRGLDVVVPVLLPQAQG